MNTEIVQRFLGLRPPVDSISLLGLTPERLTHTEIEGALRRMLARVYAHPEARSSDADELRRMLRSAAEELKDPIARQRAIARFQARPPAPSYPLESDEAGEYGQPMGSNGEREKWVDSAVGPQRVLMPSRPSRRLQPTRPTPKLTDFDRHVLALLVASGGWNAESRARLVSLAASRSVSVEGLLKVLHGLSDYAKSGGPRLSAEDITAGGRLDGDPPAPPIRLRSEPALLDRLVERVRPNFDDDDPSITIKFALFFGAVTVLVGVILLRALLSDSTPTPPVVIDTPPAPQLPAESDVDTSTDPTNAAAPIEIRPARFPARPTFLGTGVPIDAANAADQAAALAEQLDEVERRISITDDPAEAVYRNWETTVNAIGTGWVLMDKSTMQLLDRRVDAVLSTSADRVEVPDRLFRSLAVGSGLVREPLDVWRSAWRMHTAARLATHPNVPALIRERARALLEVGLETTLQEQLAPNVATRQWLDKAGGTLLDATSFDPAAYDKWELWLSALRAVADGSDFDRSVMDVVRAILQRPEDLSTEGAMVNVLGRLMEVVDYRRNEAVRDTFGGLFDDQNVSSHDLWVLTSMMATYDTTPWYGAALVLPYDADTRHRGRLRDRVLRAWPRITSDSATDVVQGRGVVVDPDDGARWMSLHDQLLQIREPMGDSDMLMRLLAWSRLNEAACLLAGQDILASGIVMAQLENYVGSVDDPSAVPGAEMLRSRGGLSSPRNAQPPAGRGQTLGSPGVWAAAYEEARNDTDAKLALLRQFMSGAATDLHPADAEVFVREMYRGQVSEIRMLARQICLDTFPRGVNVVQEMLDQLPDAPLNTELSDLIGALTNRLLPSVRAQNWAIEARLALLDHVLWLHSSPGILLDEIAGALRESYAARAQSLRGPTIGIRMPGTAQEAARMLADVYLEDARRIIASVEVPDSLAGLESRRTMRRRLARGPIQTFVAEQLTVLDLIAYISAAEQPAMAALIRDILDESIERRQGEDHVIRQAINVEQTVASIWKDRLEISPEPARGGGTQ